MKDKTGLPPTKAGFTDLDKNQEYFDLTPASIMPPRIDRGSNTTAAGGTVAVSFASAFPAAPKIFAQAVANNQVFVNVYSKTVNGFTAYGWLQATHANHNHTIGNEATHTHTQGVTGTPSATTTVSNDTHTHSIPQLTHEAHSHGGFTGYESNGSHRHTITNYTLNTHAAGTSGTPSTTVAVGSSTHTHTNPTTSAGASHTHTCSEDDAHIHFYGAAVDFDWMAISP